MVIVAAALLALGGLVVAATPLGDWFTISFGPFEGSVNGFGAEDASQFDSGDSTSDDDVIFRSDESVSSSNDDEFEWVLDPMTDGVPVTVAGGVLALLGGALLLRGLKPAPTPERRRTELMVLSAAAAVVAGIGLLWTAWSWFSFKDQWDAILDEQLGEDELGFGALFAGALDADPGYGLILAGLGFVGVGLIAAGLFLVSLLKADRVTISVTRTPDGPSSPAPPGGPSGWGPGGGQAPYPHQPGPPPGTPPPGPTGPPPGIAPQGPPSGFPPQGPPTGPPPGIPPQGPGPGAHPGSPPAAPPRWGA